MAESLSTLPLSLAIVGNAPVAVNYDRLVDSTSLVIRFNHLNNLGARTGSRMDVWVIASHPWLLHHFASDHKLLSESPLPTITELEQGNTRIWFPIPAVPAIIASRHRIPDYTERLAAITAFMSSVLKDFTEPDILTFDPRHCDDLLPETWPHHCVLPSNGYLITKYVLSSACYSAYQKTAVGFSWTGWHGHPWPSERIFFQYLAQRNHISLL
jgi:hypothetical protein